jgi:radical SAM protein with 4Fe4S-binding SPASM domain
MTKELEKKKKETNIVGKYPLEAPIPNNAMIEVTNACNLQCEMCNHKYMKRKIGFIEPKLYKKIIDELVELRVKNLGLYAGGESFLHPKIYEFIEYAKNKGIKYVYISTNGLGKFFDYKKVVESRLDSMKFSIDANKKETYDKVRKGGDWDKLIDNIKKLKEYRYDKKSSLKIYASFVVTEDNYKDLIDYKNGIGKLFDETDFEYVHNQGGQVKRYSKEKTKEYKPCGMLWNRIIVTYTGKLTICCVDFDEKLVYGDVNKNSLKREWNNDKIKKYRKYHVNGEFYKMPMCPECDMIKVK